MTEPVSASTSVEGAAAPQPHDALQAGQRLKRAREQAGLHVVALAAALKVPVKKLEALEAGRTDELPDATFARALAGSVCRQLKIDPTEILAGLPQAGVSRLGEGRELNTPFRSPRDPAGPSAASQALKRPLAAALAILLGAALVWWWVPPSSTDTAVVNPAPAPAPVTAESGTSMGAGASVGEDTAATPTTIPPAANTPSASAPSASEPALAAAPVAAPVATAAPVAQPPAPAAASVPPAPAPVAAASGAEWLQIRAKADSWVEVRAGGKVLLQRVVKADETLAFADAGPLAVVVGRADATEVLVRGKAMDMSTLARNNVARFEAK